MAVRKTQEDKLSRDAQSEIKQQLETNERLQYELGLRSTSDLDEDSTVGWPVADWSELGSQFSRVLEKYDRNSVKREGLVGVSREMEVRLLDPFDVDCLQAKLGKRSNGKVLLLLHGGFGSTKQIVESLGPSFIRQASLEYVAIIGFDHWSLQRSVIDTARNLSAELLRLVGCGNNPSNSIDIIGFCRGGLVARALVEQIGTPARKTDPNEIVRNVALVGTPNFGSRLQNPEAWGKSADLLLIVSILDSTGFYAKLSSLLAQLSVISQEKKYSKKELQEIAAGAMLFDPELPSVLSPPHGVNYFLIASAFAPSSSVNIPKIVQEYCVSSGYFDQPHDLIVNTSEAWSAKPRVDGGSRKRKYFKSVHSLLITPRDVAFYETDNGIGFSEIETPTGAKTIEQDGSTIPTCFQIQRVRNTFRLDFLKAVSSRCTAHFTSWHLLRRSLVESRLTPKCNFTGQNKIDICQFGLRHSFN